MAFAPTRARLAMTRGRGVSRSRARSRASAPRPRATTTEEDDDDENAPTSGTSTPEYGRNPLTGEPLEAEGQFTAIVTGIVSVALAIGYLGLANALDSRDMAPPPLEAMGDGSARPADEIRAR
jgi:hypothetical protein